MAGSLLPTAPKARAVLAVVACGLVAALAALASVSTIGLAPPHLALHRFSVAGAATRVVVDNRRPLVGDRLAVDGDYTTLQKRAVLLASLLAADPGLDVVARRAGVPRAQLVGRSRVTANVQGALIDPGSEVRAEALRTDGAPYRLDVQTDPALPVISVFAQAPSVAVAERLADAAAGGLREELRTIALRARHDPRDQLSVTQPGAARGAVISSSAGVETAALTFVLALGLSAAGLALAVRLRRPRPRPGLGVSALPPPGRGRESRSPGPGGDWPRTTRVLPWMLAVMLGVVWLTPFNVIQLSYSLPVDLKLDRLVLPCIVVTWLLAMAAGGPAAPRVRLTWVHVALGAVVATALLSLVLDARGLGRTLELDASIKKLTLLASYVGLFLVVASVVRRGEVPAFLRLTLVLSVLCAAGTIWEYRFHYNAFYSLSRTLLPGAFTVGEAESAARDEIGRRLVRGPGEVPLEAVAMLSMGLGIAVVGLLAAQRPRQRLLHGLATALLLAAISSTERKSALLAPAAVLLTLACFRRRELARLAPLGLAIGAGMLALTPGAASSVVNQFHRSNLGVDTVSDRSSDYDAVRPDVWLHLAFGRGYGSYAPRSHRILDMELLRQLVEVGVVGLLAFVVLLGTVVAVARGPIHGRVPGEAQAALAAAAAAMALLVVSTLFDAMAFPHSPYIALWMAGLLAVVVVHRREPGPEVAWSS